MNLCSPLVTESIFWFMNRFTRTYLYLDPNNYQFVSNDIMNTFGKTGSGLMVLEKMLEMVSKNIHLWHSDSSVLLQIVRLFDTLSGNQDIRNALVESSTVIISTNPQLCFITSFLFCFCY